VTGVQTCALPISIQSGIRADTGEKLAVVQPVEDFHRKMEVQQFTRYTWQDAFKAALEHDDIPPPWEEKYKRLTRDGQKKGRGWKYAQ